MTSSYISNVPMHISDALMHTSNAPNIRDTLTHISDILNHMSDKPNINNILFHMDINNRATLIRDTTNISDTLT